MTSLRLDGVKRLLCLGAHSDDIEIGCGATLLRFIQEQPDLRIYWFVFNANGIRAREAKQSAGEFLHGTPP